MRRNHHLTAWLMALCLMLLQGCSLFGLQAPQSIEDRIQYAKAGVGAAYRTLGDQVATKTITPPRAVQVFQRIEAVENQVALAEQLLKGGRPTDATQTLNLALNALQLLRNELAQKGAP